MDKTEIVRHLLTWTPFLLEGFAWNILIATCACLLGTAVGVALVRLRSSPIKALAMSGDWLAQAFYLVPTLGLMFYCALLLPQEVELPGLGTYAFPAWIKAVLALSAAQISFTAHNLGPALKLWHQGQRSAALLFLPNWGGSLVITVIASSAASLVGVSEIVSRCNKIISASQNTDLMMPIYFYASLYFLAFCLPLTYAMRRLRARLNRPNLP